MLLLSSYSAWTWQEHIYKKKKKKKTEPTPRLKPCLCKDRQCLQCQQERKTNHRFNNNHNCLDLWVKEKTPLHHQPLHLRPAPTPPRLASPPLGSESRHWPKGCVASVDKDLVPDLSLRLLMPEIRHRANSQPVHQGKWASWVLQGRQLPCWSENEFNYSARTKRSPVWFVISKSWTYHRYLVSVLLLSHDYLSGEGKKTFYLNFVPVLVTYLTLDTNSIFLVIQNKYNTLKIASVSSRTFIHKKIKTSL